MSETWDVIVVGAGIGGLSAASILASEGMKVLVIEKEDRVGGRALSLRGEELTGNGPEWYRRLLAGQYCYLADSEPSLEEIAERGLLDGYTLDLGFHAASLAGEGYFATLRDLIGGFGDRAVPIVPFLAASWLDGQFYEEFPLQQVAQMDPKLQAEMDRLGVDIMTFFGDLVTLGPEEAQRLDRLSLYDHLVNTGFAESKLLFDFWRCNGTLMTTINNPHEISVGDILRYSKEVIFPAIMTDEDQFIGGWPADGAMAWPKAVADRFRDLGGDLRLGTRAASIELEGDTVKGVRIKTNNGGPFLPAKQVVLNMPIQELFRYVREDAFPREFAARVRSLYGYGSLNVYYGLSDLPMPEEHAKHLMKTPCVVPRSEGFDYDVYMAWGIQSFDNPSIVPRGKNLFTAYLPLTEEESRDHELVARVVRAVPEFLEETYPGFNDSVDWALYPACVKLEGVAKSVTQAGSLKPDVKSPGVEGLYFAGDTSRGYGVGMDCACASGILCASAVTGSDYGLY